VAEPLIHEPAEPVAEPEPTRGRRLPVGRPRLPRARFLRRLRLSRVGTAYLLLVLALGGGIAGIVLATTGASHSKHTAAPQAASGGDWSAWHPVSLGSSAVREIATHVSAEYRLASGKQLLNVVAHEPAINNGLQTFAVSTLELRSDKSDLGARIFGIGNGVMYILCGSGPDCSIGEGKASEARGTLVRREALELALYTFKYVGDVDTVLAFVPPAPGVTDKQFIVLRRDDVASYMRHPLAATIGGERKLTTTDLSKKDGRASDAIALPHLYVLAQTQQLPDDTLALLLTPQSLPTL
jgi:hypothetical protein